MSDIDYQLKVLRENLTQEREVLSAISNNQNHAEVKTHVEQLEADIKKLEDWKKDQERIRATAYSNGAPSGVA